MEPQKNSLLGMSIERAVLVTLIAGWIGTGLLGLGLLAATVIASPNEEAVPPPSSLSTPVSTVAPNEEIIPADPQPEPAAPVPEPTELPTISPALESTPAQSVDENDLCALAEDSCLARCKNTTSHEDTSSTGGNSAALAQCQAACSLGEKRCVSGRAEDPCGHFHGACRFHCSGSDDKARSLSGPECTLSCDRGRNTCFNKFKGTREKAQL